MNNPYASPDAVLVQRAVGVLRSRLRKCGISIYISGIDGAGKTTLARAFVEILEAANMPARHMHVYQWYLNIILTPVLLLHNRYLGRRILIFDRGIYDNIAVLYLRQGCPEWMPRAAIDMVAALYPRMDHHFYLVTTFSEAVQRRPDTCAKRFMALTEIYEGIASRVRCIQLRSDKRLFCAALRNIAGEV
jgi:thymidylate kinase